MNRRTVMVVSMAVMLAALWLVLFYLPEEQEQTARRAEIAAAEARLTDFRNTMLLVPQYIERRENLERLRQSMASPLHLKQTILELIDRLELLSSNHGMRIFEITPPVEELLQLNNLNRGDHEPDFLNITLNLHGNFISFGRFVEKLESEPYFRGVNRCHIISPAQSGSPVVYTIGFRALLGAVEEAP